MENQVVDEEKLNKEEPKHKKSVGKNYIYNLIYQLFLLVVPIAVTPYVARVLGDDGSGKYSFTFSIVTYFTLFAALGFQTYGQREIAKHQKEKHEQSVVFWEIVIAKLIPVLLTLAVYFLLTSINVYGSSYNDLMIILGIQVIAVGFDIVFYFQGNEEFGRIVIRNVIIKSLGIISIFIFVKTRDDLWIYTLIQSLTILISNLSLWLYLPKMLDKVKLKELHPLKHLLPTFILFLPTIAISVYTSLDKTLIGLLVKGTTEVTLDDGTVIVKKLSDIENGNYEYAEKLVKMAMTVITSLGVVMIPRNTKKYNDGDIEGLKEGILLTTKIVLLFGVPLMLGCIAIADNLIPWYLGNTYDKAANLMKILSPLILIIGLSNVFGLQILIPTNHDKKYTIAIICGSCVNLLLNLILIKTYKSYGAAIATLVAETVVTILMYIFSRKYVNIWKVILSSWKYIIAGAIMFIPCYYLGKYLNSSIINTILIALCGVVIYFIVLLILREEIVYKTIKTKIFKNRKE